MKIINYDANGKLIPDLSEVTLSEELSMIYYQLLLKNRKADSDGN